MRDFLVVLTVVLLVVMVKPGCDRRKDVTADCRKVCGDVGHDFSYAQKTGFFTFKCQCKRLPKQPVKIPTQR